MTHLLRFFEPFAYLKMTTARSQRFVQCMRCIRFVDLRPRKSLAGLMAAMIKEETNLYTLRAMLFNYKFVVSVCHATAPNASQLDAIPLSLRTISTSRMLTSHGKQSI